MVTRVLRFLDRFHWFWLALAAPFLLFPSAQRCLVMLVVPALFLLRWLALQTEKQMIPQDTNAVNLNRQTIIPFTPLNGVLLLMMMMVLVSLWATFDINFSLPKISGMVLGLGIFFVFTREGQTPRGWWLGFLFFMAIGFSIAAIGLLGTHWVSKVTFMTPIVSRLAPRITGLPGVEEGFNQNSVAGDMLWVIPSFCIFSWLLLAKAKDLRDIIGRGRTIALIVLTIGATLWTIAILILTQSREGYISLALTLPVMTLIALSSKWRRYGLVILVLLAIVMGALLASHLGQIHIWLVGGDQTTSSAFSLDSFKGRLEVWSAAINGIRDFPFTGMGMNTFRKVALVLYPLPDISSDVGHAHNEFLQAALDLGIPGLIAFIGLYIVAFWMLIRTWMEVRVRVRSAARRQHTAIPGTKPGGWLSAINSSLIVDGRLVQMAVLGLGGGLLAHLVWGLTDAMALGARPAFVFWIILGLISGLYQQTQENWARVDGSVFTKGPTIGLAK